MYPEGCHSTQQIFVANFKPELFQVLPDGSLTPPDPGRTKQIVKVEMEPE